MTLGTLYQDLITEIITQLKTIAELGDDTKGARVVSWQMRHIPIDDRYECEVKAGPMTILGGTTTRSTNNNFQIICDLLYYSNVTNDLGFPKALSVAEKMYDQFHIGNINSLGRIARVSIFPGDGELSRNNLLAIPIRVLIDIEKVITQ